MASYTDIFIDQGSTYSSTIDVSDKNGFPFDLTDYSSRGQIRRSYHSQTAIDFVTSIIQPDDIGKVSISLSAAVTREMKAGRYVYDIEVFNDETEDVIRISEGQVEISPASTKPSDVSDV
jgi:hypothetical protein